jgi:hypothetical protein
VRGTAIPRGWRPCAQATDADAQEAARARVWAAYLALVQALAAAQLEEVGAGGRYAHAAPAVLLRGSLRARGVRASLAEGLPAGAAARAGRTVRCDDRTLFVWRLCVRAYLTQATRGRQPGAREDRHSCTHL